MKEHTFDNLMALCPTCHTRFDKGEIDRKAMRQYKANLSVLTGREREASPRVETAKGGPLVLPLMLTDDGGHNVEILNRGETDVWDVVIENHEPREPPGIDQYRKGTLPFIRAGETEKAFLSDEEHTYSIDRPGYGLRIIWTDRDQGQTLSAHFFASERKRGARFATDDDA